MPNIDPMTIAIVGSVIAGGIGGSYVLLGIIFRQQNAKIKEQEEQNDTKVKELDGKIIKLEKEQTEKFDKLEKICGDYLTKGHHALLCDVSSLKIKEHLTTELSKLKDELFSEFRKLGNTIKTTNGKK